MRLIEIIGNEGVIPRLKARERDEALVELVDQLVATKRVRDEDREDLLMALLKREVPDQDAVRVVLTHP